METTVKEHVAFTSHLGEGTESPLYTLHVCNFLLYSSFHFPNVQFLVLHASLSPVCNNDICITAPMYTYTSTHFPLLITYQICFYSNTTVILFYSTKLPFLFDLFNIAIFLYFLYFYIFFILLHWRRSMLSDLFLRSSTFHGNVDPVLTCIWQIKTEPNWTELNLWGTLRTNSSADLLKGNASRNVEYFSVSFAYSCVYCNKW